MFGNGGSDVARSPSFTPSPDASAGRPAGVTGDAQASSERFLLLMFSLIRVAILVQVTVAGLVAWERFRHPLLVVALLAAVVAESTLVIEAGRRRGALDRRWLLALDMTTGAAALLAPVALLKSPRDPYLDVFFYPYTVAAMSLAGIVIRRLPGIVLLTALMSGVYLAVSTVQSGFGSTLAVNSVTYWAWALISWGASGWYRRLSGQLDQARQEALERGMELASARHAQELQALKTQAIEAELEHERERARNFRDLHDRVLQTLEILGRGGWPLDDRIRERIAAEAVWLRRLIEGGLGRARDDLVVALGEVVERQAIAGLRVELNAARLSHDGDRLAVPCEVVTALAGAVDEALSNVRKHAGTGHAVVRAAPERGGVLVSVLDRGRGFDPATVRHGVGIPHSLIARLRQVGGTVRIDSAPGDGTYVELWAPCAATGAGANGSRRGARNASANGRPVH